MLANVIKEQSPDAIEFGVPFFTGRYWPTGNQIWGIWTDFGALPDTTYKQVDVNIGDVPIVKLTGVARNGNYAFPLPNASGTLTENVYMGFTGTKISITTGMNRSAYSAWVYIEYLV